MNLKNVLNWISKVAFDDSAWDGSASNWDTAEAYCSDCLIDMNESGAEKSKDKCKLPYRKPGSKAINKGALRAIASGARGLSAVDAPMEAKRAAARKAVGWWKSAFGKEAPPSMMRMAGMSMGKDTSQVLVVKDSEGQWWFLGIYSNKFKDLDGEILSEKSHEEYVAWLKETGFKPVITAYHLPRAKDPAFWTKVFDTFEHNTPVLQKIVDVFYKPTAFAKAERVVYLNGFTAVAAKFLPGKEQVAERLSKVKNLGMSHGFINVESNANIFNKYRTFEMSILRSVRAANMFTRSLALLTRGTDMAGQKDEEKALTAEDRAVLTEVFGEDVVAKLESDTNKSSDVLSRLLAFKDAVEDKASDEDEDEDEDMPMDEEDMPKKKKEQKEQEEVPVEEKQEETPVLTVDVVAKATRETFEGLQVVLTEMQQKIESLEAQNAALKSEIEKSVKTVEEIKKSDDEKIASNWLPPINWRQGFSATKSDDNLVKNEKEKEALTENGPEDSQPKPQNAVMAHALAPLFTQGLRG